MSMSTRLTSSLTFFFFSSRRRHTRFKCDWSSDGCSSDKKRRGHCRERGEWWVDAVSSKKKRRGNMKFKVNGSSDVSILEVVIRIDEWDTETLYAILCAS